MKDSGRWASALSVCDQKFELFDFVTPRILTTLRIYVGWLLCRRGVALNLLIVCLLVALNPYDLVNAIGAVMTFAITLQFIIVFAFSYVALIAIWLALRHGEQVVRVFRIFFSLAAATLATISTIFLALLYMGEEFVLRAAVAEVPYVFLLTQILEAIFFAFVAPRRLSIREVSPPKEPEPAPAPPAPPVEEAPATLAIAGRQLPLNEVLHISSHGHYLRCLVGAEEVWLRGRMLDVLAQTDEKDGVQPRRSWWVAARAVRELRRAGSGDVLVLTDGVEIAVPRARRDDVRAWIDARAGD